MKIMSTPSVLNSYNNSNSNYRQNSLNLGYNAGNQHAISFKGTNSKVFTPFSKYYDKMTDFIAKRLVGVLNTKVAERYLKWSSKYNMIAHYTAFTGLIVSGFYIKQTLGNKKLDEKKKKTLAINQAATSVLSTTLAYIADKSINNKINEVTNKYNAINIKNATKKISGNWTAGFKAAKSIVIFGAIYRFITPVIVTPIANLIGNMLNKESNDQKLQKHN